MTRIEGWALPRGAQPAGTEVRKVGGAEVEWPIIDPVAAVRLVDQLRSARTSLLDRGATSIARVLGQVGVRFLDRDDPLHTVAIEAVVAESGLSEPMALRVLAGMATDWTPDRLQRLVAEEFGDPPLLDGFVDGIRRIGAWGDDFALHLVSGSVPGVGTTSLIRSLLVKSPVLLKPGAGDVALPVLFLRALAEADADLADSAAVAYWPGGEGESEATFLTRADRVVVYGGSETISRVRSRVPSGVPLVEYGHRVGFSVVGPGDFDADALARAVGLFDQRGCVTTHQLFVLGEQERVDRVVGALGSALARLESELPRGRPDPSEVSAIRQEVEAAELRAHATGDAFSGGAGEGWAVYAAADPGLEAGPGGRTVRAVRAHSVGQIVADVHRLRHHLQTVGFGGFADGGKELALRLGAAGATRVVPFDRVPFPPGWWLHDGRGPLEALVRRVEWEEEGQTSSSSST